MHIVFRRGILRLVLCLVTLFVYGAAQAAQPRVLIYNKNQTGKGLYVHANIKAASEAIKRICEQSNIPADVSDDPSAFTPANLKRYQAIIFNNSNNEILETEEQKAALQRFVRAGGGVVGIHSATGSMRKWPYFWELMGGKFVRHPKMQKFTVKVKDPNDISTKHMPAEFEWTDEFYYVDNIPDGRHVLLVGDLKSLDDPGKAKFPGEQFGTEYPLAWRRSFDGGRQWYTALGHQPEHYADPLLIKHILGGILWVTEQNKQPQ